MKLKYLVAVCFLSGSSAGFALESGYQTVGRLQQWAVPTGSMASPAGNVFLGANSACNSTGIYTYTREVAESALGRNALAAVLAAKMGGKKINITYECITSQAWIQGIDIE